MWRVRGLGLPVSETRAGMAFFFGIELPKARCHKLQYGLSMAILYLIYVALIIKNE